MYISKSWSHPVLRMVAGTALAASILLCGSVPIQADGADTLTNLKNQYAALQQQQQDLQSKINSQSSQLQSVNQQVNLLNQSITLTNQQISVLNTQIADTDAQLTAKAADVAATQKRVDENYALYKQRMRAMYEAGDVSYVEVLLSASDINDFLSRAEMLKAVSVHDNDLINSLKTDVQKLKDDQAALQTDKENLTTAQSTLFVKQNSLSSQKAQQAQLSEQLKAGITSAQQQAASVKQQAQKTDSQINAEIAAEAAARAKQLAAQQAIQTPTAGGKSSGGSTGFVSGNASIALAYASDQLNKHYLINTDGPTTYDCSGLTMQAYAQIGIALTHSAAEQADGVLAGGGTVGTVISGRNYGSLKAGDLLFFSTSGGGISHVGIYDGNQGFIGANGHDDVGYVKHVDNFLSDSYWGSRYRFARRIVG